MMKKYFFVLCALMMTLSGFAQSQTRWKGVNASSLTTGHKYYLYNVGTGRMVVAGGDWGVQARLFYELSGIQLTWGGSCFQSGFATGNASVLGCNVPAVTANQGWTDDSGTFTLILDANINYTNGSQGGTRQVHFERIPGETGDTYTYFVHEDMRGTTYWWGAVYGKNDGNHEGDPNGELVMLASSFDKMTWSTADPTQASPATEYKCELKSVENGYDYELNADGTVNRSMDSEVVVFNADTKIPMRDLYKWRIVSEEEFQEMVNGVGDIVTGAVADLTSYIYDYDFSRNNWDFFETPGGWSANKFSDVTYATSSSSTGRYGYTWGYIDGSSSSKTNNQTNPRKTNHAWNEPVRLKAQFDSKTGAKYGMLEFEGIGTASSYVNVQNPGSYMVRAYGFYQGEHPAYVFVSTKNPAAADFSTADIINYVPLKPAPQTYTKNTEAGVQAAAEVLTTAKDDYLVQVDIHNVPAGNLYFGVAKYDATQVAAESTTETTVEAPYVLHNGSNYMNGEGERTTSESSAQKWLVEDGTNYLYYLDGEGKRYLAHGSSSGSGANTVYYVTTSTSTTNAVKYSELYGATFSTGNNTYRLRYYTQGNTREFRFYRTTSSTGNAVTATGTTITNVIPLYSYDSDWVCADQFMLYYLGTEEPVYLDENKTDITEYPYISGTTYNNRNIRLMRAFVKNAWNTFVTPFALTAVQVRTAFGDGARVAVLDGISTISSEPGVLDFRSIPLPAEGDAITPGKFYLIKPVKDPLTSAGVEGSYYDLGMHTFTWGTFENFTSESVESTTEGVSVTSYGCYVSSNPYTNGLDASAYTNGVFAPQGSYVIGSKEENGSYASTYLSRLTKNMRIKGFRGWLVEEALPQSGEAKLHSIVFNAPDAEGTLPTAINDIVKQPVVKEGVYDLMGRRVAADAKSLPKGLYIINGKKCIIK